MLPKLKEQCYNSGIRVTEGDLFVSNYYFIKENKNTSGMNKRSKNNEEASTGYRTTGCHAVLSRDIGRVNTAGGISVVF